MTSPRSPNCACMQRTPVPSFSQPPHRATITPQGLAAAALRSSSSSSWLVSGCRLRSARPLDYSARCLARPWLQVHAAVFAAALEATPVSLCGFVEPTLVVSCPTGTQMSWAFSVIQALEPQLVLTSGGFCVNLSPMVVYGWTEGAFVLVASSSSNRLE